MNFLQSFLKAVKPRFDDDALDRLNYYYTTVIILLLSLTISAKQYVGQPIQCWVPAQFTGAWEQYAENFCFVQNTYWLPLQDYIPKQPGVRRNRELGYYQWVPFILAIEAMLFYVPCLIWRMFNMRSEYNLQNIVQLCAASDNIDVETRARSVEIVSRHIEDAINLRHEMVFNYKQLDSCLLHRVLSHTSGIYMCTAYLVVKVLYVVNVIGQFFLLNAFIGARSRWWGIQIISDLYNGYEWEESGHFPRVRVIGNLHKYTIQCVLMINMFNEKIFLFLWLWFFIVSAASAFGFIYWSVLILPQSCRATFVRKYLGPDSNLLELAGSCSDFNSKRNIRHLFLKFTEEELTPDGVLLMRIISINAGDLITSQIFAQIWKRHVEKYNNKLQLPGKWIDESAIRRRRKTSQSDEEFFDNSKKLPKFAGNPTDGGSYEGDRTNLMLGVSV